MILPWHQSDWQRIAGAVASQHHGLMLSGCPGTGKREFAMELAQRILCGQTSTADPCGVCQDCKLFHAGTHPDLHLLTSEYETVNGRMDLAAKYSERYQDGVARDKKVNPGRIIPVDQVRLLIDRFYQSSHIAANRVALVMPADRLNTNAANALLKMLEEPPEGAYFILVADQPGLLPATIRSRCLLETLARPAASVARQWLAEQGAGAELMASVDGAVDGPIHLLQKERSGELTQQHENLGALLGVMTGRQDPVALAAAMSKQEILPLLQWMQSIFVELIKWHSAGQVPVWAAKTGLDISRISSIKLHSVYDKIGRYRNIARDQINPQLALDEILIAVQHGLRS